MSWQRPNIGSRVTREGHARFWERPEVEFLRATRHFRQIGAVATLRGCPLRPESGHWELSTLARSSRGPPISHWDGFLASLRLGPHACDCRTLESALGLTECERSVKWL